MVSKPKPGLVRTLAHSHSLSHSHHPGHKHTLSYAHYVPTSALPGLGPILGLPQTSLSAPVVSHYPSPSVSQVIARRPGTGRTEGHERPSDQERESERSGGAGHSAPWPLLPAIPPRESVINTSAYQALSIPWDGLSTYSATDAVIGAFSEMVVTPYHRTFTPLRHPQACSARRKYTTSTNPSRNASGYMNHPSSSLPDFYYSSIIYSKYGSAPGHQGPGTELPDPPYVHSYPPPPPPSPGPSRPPQDQAVNPRPSETHTVLSPAPLAPGDTGGTSNPTSSLVIGGAQYLSPAAVHPAPLTPPDESKPVSYSAYTSKFVFRFGASGLAKDRPITQTPRPPRKGASATPPPRPRSFPLIDIKAPARLSSVSIGEDSYFATPEGICVADGVGGWARSGRGGADAGRWSRLLTHYCHDEVRAWWEGAEEYCEDVKSEQEEGKGWKGIWRKKEEVGRAGDELGLPEGRTRRKLDPVEVMQRGFEKCLSCVHSEHAFNFPLQLGTHSRDEPMKDAKQFEVEVEERDVVVVGSDGLMDNLFDEDILDVLATFAPLTADSAPTSIGGLPTPPSSRPGTPSSDLPPFNPQKLSEALCKKAREVSEELNATTPFMVRAIEEGIDFVGGKKDDISVVVGVIRNGSTGGELWT